MHISGLRFRRLRQIGIVHVESMPIQSSRPQHAVMRINILIGTRIGKQIGNPSHFIGVFGDVGLRYTSSNSDISVPQASSCAGVLVGANRGVTA